MKAIKTGFPGVSVKRKRGLLIKKKQTGMKAKDSRKPSSQSLFLSLSRLHVNFSKTSLQAHQKDPFSQSPCPPAPFPRKLWKAAQPSLSGSPASAMGSLLSSCPAELWKLRRHFPHCVGQCGAGIDADRNSNRFGENGNAQIASLAKCQPLF